MKKTLQECKEIVAKDNQFSDWESLLLWCEKFKVCYYTDLANKMYYEQSDTENAILKKALNEIIDPIKFIKDNLKDGERLNGMYMLELSNSPSYLKGIALHALRITEPNPPQK